MIRGLQEHQPSNPFQPPCQLGANPYSNGTTNPFQPPSQRPAFQPPITPAGWKPGLGLAARRFPPSDKSSKTAAGADASHRNAICAQSSCRSSRIVDAQMALWRLSMTYSDAKPTAAAMRMRRSRERRRDNLRCLHVELRETEIAALVREGFLKSEARNERKAIIEALYRFLESNLEGIA
jgi:hypothetical protein